MNLNKILSCPARKKILEFFNLNPASIDTISGIATWTGLDKKDASKALEELAKSGILTPHRVSSTVGYAYTSDKKTVEKIRKYFMVRKVYPDGHK